jgi:hypothetical protein
MARQLLVAGALLAAALVEPHFARADILIGAAAPLVRTLEGRKIRADGTINALTATRGPGVPTMRSNAAHVRCPRMQTDA